MLFFRAKAQAPNFRAEAQAPKVINNNTNTMTAEQLISNARATNATVLDLGNCGLTQVPDLSGLPYLTTLNLGTWYFEYNTLANEWEAKETQNKGEKNQLTDLTGIEILKSSLLSLSFSRNQVSDIRPLEKLTALTYLYFNGNQVSDISPLEKLSTLTNLEFSWNQVSDICPLEKLTALTNLNFWGNQVSDIRPLEKLTALTNLYFPDNQVSDIRPLEKLTALTNLYFFSNQVSDIRPLEKLTALTQLNFYSNTVSNIRPLEKLTALTYLDFSSNQVGDIRPLEKLTALTYLDFSSNQVGDIRPLEKLTALTNLNFNSNQVSDIRPLEKLTALTNLNFNSNQVSDIRPLEKLSTLTNLEFSWNQVSDICPLEKLTALTNLNFNSNQVSNICPLEKLIKLREIYIDHTPFAKEHPEIASGGIKAIQAYLASTSFDYLREAKLIIVGLPRAGKTTLARKVVNIEADFPTEEETSRNIEVVPHYFQDAQGRQYRMNIWDFGGHQIYHATHQFFLTEKALYVILSSTREEKEDFDYWLQIVDMLSQKSPMILVQNIHEERSVELRNLATFHAAELNVKELCSLNFKKDKAALQQLITMLQHRLTELPHIHSKIPSNWLAIRKEIEEMTNSKENREAGKSDLLDSLPLLRYLSICAKHGLDEETALAVGRVFHQIGVFLHFQDEPMLYDFLILNKLWATDAVYRIIDDATIKKEQKGSFSSKNYRKLWSEAHYCHHHRDLLALMKKFELCYQVNEQDLYIVPQLKSKEAPSNLPSPKEGEPVLVVSYEYAFMPKGIPARLSVRMHKVILHQDWVWSEGAVFYKDNSKAIVSSPYLQNKIEIRTWGLQARELMTSICYELEKIHTSFPQLAFIKRIPCNCEACIKGIVKHSYNYEELLERLQNNKYTIECGVKPYHTVKVQQLLDTVFTHNIEEKVAKERRIPSKRNTSPSPQEIHIHNTIKQDAPSQVPTPSLPETKWYYRWWAILIGILTLIALVAGILADGFDLNFLKLL